MKRPETLDLSQLTVTRHDRDAAGMRYVYPVLSRRARGLSIGINLNPNNACNWRCRYCQVPNLTRGTSPAIDLRWLERELEVMAEMVLRGSIASANPDQAPGRPRDFSISGNGEPTTCRELMEVLELVATKREQYFASPPVPIVLITNGSLVDRPKVQACLRRLGELGGEVWFKLDAGSDEGQRWVNGTRTSLERQVQRLSASAALCQTWVQTCWFEVENCPPEPAEVDGYLDALARAVDSGAPLAGVLLYSIARQPELPEGAALSPVDATWLKQLAVRIKGLGLEARVTP